MYPMANGVLSGDANYWLGNQPNTHIEDMAVRVYSIQMASCNKGQLVETMALEP